MRSTLGGGWVVGLRPSNSSVGEMRLLLMPSKGKSTRAVDPPSRNHCLTGSPDTKGELLGMGGGGNYS